MDPKSPKGNCCSSMKGKNVKSTYRQCVLERVSTMVSAEKPGGCKGRKVNDLRAGIMRRQVNKKEQVHVGGPPTPQGKNRMVVRACKLNDQTKNHAFSCVK